MDTQVNTHNKLATHKCTHTQCVYVWERETDRKRERQRETERDRETEREIGRDRWLFHTKKLWEIMAFHFFAIVYSEVVLRCFVLCVYAKGRIVIPGNEDSISWSGALWLIDVIFSNYSTSHCQSFLMENHYTSIYGSLKILFSL